METPRTPCRQSGLTLVELAIGLAVLAVIVRLAVPSMDAFLAAVSLNGASQELMGDLHLARSEALSRNQRVTICKSTDGVQCAADGNWEQGWVIFEDLDHSGTLDAGEAVIARRDALAPGLRLSGNATVASYVSYTGKGTSRLTNGGFQAGTLTLCRVSASVTDARQVIVNAVGRPRLQKSTVPACA
jgi:type IV fimbrial biogenesis protein FimT